MSRAHEDLFLMLTPAGTLRAHEAAVPDATGLALQSLMAGASAPLRQAWLAAHPGHEAILATSLEEGWIHEVSRPLRAPDTKLDNYLPHAIAGLSGSRTAALASDEGFCLARTGYSEEEAETLCAAAADFFDFAARQRQRGWAGSGRAVSFHDGIDMLLPTTTFMLFWVDGVGYWLILGGEPLVNNVAFVELVWGLRAAGTKFTPRAADVQAGRRFQSGG
ncbi:hypothetical protein EII20_02275 [Comamonadaceae bacterium OH2545_COT-014]|nr:hypothetical protein EII20_02275 [Comamonadaceae bacterium OH2545_COT-014]